MNLRRKVCEDGDPRVLGAAGSHALGAMLGAPYDPGEVADLTGREVERLKRSDWQVRQDAAEALAAMGPTAARSLRLGGYANNWEEHDPRGWVTH